MGTPEPPASLLRNPLGRIDSMPSTSSPLAGASTRALHTIRAAERQQARERRMSRSSVDETRIPGLVLPPKHLFTFTVGRKQSLARFLLGSSQEVASTLEALASSLSFKDDEIVAYLNLEDLSKTSAWHRDIGDIYGDEAGSPHRPSEASNTGPTPTPTPAPAPAPIARPQSRGMGTQPPYVSTKTSGPLSVMGRSEGQLSEQTLSRLGPISAAGAGPELSEPR